MLSPAGERPERQRERDRERLAVVTIVRSPITLSNNTEYVPLVAKRNRSGYSQAVSANQLYPVLQPESRGVLKFRVEEMYKYKYIDISILNYCMDVYYHDEKNIYIHM
jgi:hypothetical protein